MSDIEKGMLGPEPTNETERYWYQMAGQKTKDIGAMVLKLKELEKELADVRQKLIDELAKNALTETGVAALARLEAENARYFKALEKFASWCPEKEPEEIDYDEDNKNDLVASALECQSWEYGQIAKEALTPAPAEKGVCGCGDREECSNCSPRKSRKHSEACAIRNLPGTIDCTCYPGGPDSSPVITTSPEILTKIIHDTIGKEEALLALNNRVREWAALTRSFVQREAAQQALESLTDILDLWECWKPQNVDYSDRINKAKESAAALRDSMGE